MIKTRIVRKHPADIPVCLLFTTVQLTLMTVISSYYLRHNTNSKRQKSCLYSQGFKWSCRSAKPLGFRGGTDLYMSLLFPHWFEPVYCYHTNMYMSVLLPHLPVHVTTVTTLLYLSCPVTTLTSTYLSCYPTLWPVPVCPVTTLWVVPVATVTTVCSVRVPISQIFRYYILTLYRYKMFNIRYTCIIWYFL